MANLGQFVFGKNAVNDVVIVDPASTLVLAENHKRTYVAICNTGLVDVYISLGAEAELGKGIKLAASTGSFEINLTNFWNGSIYAISADSSDGVLSFTEISA